MIELKIHRACGQKYKFDVEPVNNRLHFTVACPVCGADGTAQANALLDQMTIFKVVEPAPAPAAVPPPSPPVVPRLTAPSRSPAPAIQTSAAVRSAPPIRPGVAKLGVAPANPEQVEAEARARSFGATSLRKSPIS